MEALALGRPVLVAETTALAELVAQGHARGVSPHARPEEVALAILDQLFQPLVPTRLELPTWDECAANLLSLYHDVLGVRRCAS
jgi:glycosyltransferase involved in cell wall biosynthesis